MYIHICIYRTQMRSFFCQVDSYEGGFYRAVLATHAEKYGYEIAHRISEYNGGIDCSQHAASFRRWIATRVASKCVPCLTQTAMQSDSNSHAPPTGKAASGKRVGLT